MNNTQRLLNTNHVPGIVLNVFLCLLPRGVLKEPQEADTVLPI